MLCQEALHIFLGFFSSTPLSQATINNFPFYTMLVLQYLHCIGLRENLAHSSSDMELEQVILLNEPLVDANLEVFYRKSVRFTSSCLLAWPSFTGYWPLDSKSEIVFIPSQDACFSECSVVSFSGVLGPSFLQCSLALFIYLFRKSLLCFHFLKVILSICPLRVLFASFFFVFLYSCVCTLTLCVKYFVKI